MPREGSVPKSPRLGLQETRGTQPAAHLGRDVGASIPSQVGGTGALENSVSSRLTHPCPTELTLPAHRALSLIAGRKPPKPV